MPPHKIRIVRYEEKEKRTINGIRKNMYIMNDNFKATYALFIPIQTANVFDPLALSKG
jgi:hypothetical protein